MTTLLYCGNLGLGHDLETTIRAVHKLEHGVDLKLIFVGNGKAKQPLQRLTMELRLDNVEFRPPVPLYKLPSVLASGDIHLVSQKPGTQGLFVPSKIYGILTVAKPVLFVGPSDCEVASIVNRSRAGFVVRPGDVDGIANALKQLALNPDIRKAMGKSGREYYEKHFGREKSVSRIIKAIESIV